MLRLDIDEVNPLVEGLARSKLSDVAVLMAGKEGFDDVTDLLKA